jgi:hypothetical protein
VRKKGAGRDKALARGLPVSSIFGHADADICQSGRRVDIPEGVISKVPCADFDAKRQFLRDHLEKIIFNVGRITIIGCGSNVLGTAARDP